jgi:hypothetical protein
MDFSDSTEEAKFRTEARAFIAANAPAYLKTFLEKSGFGTTNTGHYNLLEEAKKWQKKKA